MNSFRDKEWIPSTYVVAEGSIIPLAVALGDVENISRRMFGKQGVEIICIKTLGCRE